jgi:hypothetical protein
MFDPVTTLGLELKREIPKGEARLKWLRTEKGYKECISALRRAGYSDAYLSQAIKDLSYGEICLPFQVRDVSEIR